MKIRLLAPSPWSARSPRWPPAPRRSAAVPRPLWRHGLSGLEAGRVDVRDRPRHRHVRRGPDARRSRRAQGLGLTVQPMQHVPLALVRGTVARCTPAVTTGAANDVYPDERDQAARHRVVQRDGRARPAREGLHRQGRDRRRRRLRLRRQPPGPRRPRRPQREARQRRVRERAARLDQHDRRRRTRPARTRTPTSAAATARTSPGIIAADSTTDPRGHFGVAPDANLVCYSIGEVLFTTAVVTAYDHMLDQPDLWGIKVVNNSWGNSFRQFDPRDPVRS